ncbi:MAG: MFS transporter [Clostridiales bacterium]|jgi:MFS family permease|nr:MFS transporter [Clostridiales bacterium]
MQKCVQGENQEQTKLWNKTYILVLLLSTFNQSVSQMVTPFISKYAISLGAPMTIAATISGLMSISALVLRPASGLFSDRFNRKRIITITSIITAICMYLYSMSSSVTMLIGVRLVHGIVFSFSGVAMMAFNAMYMPKERLAEGMGWMALGSVVSSALGPNLGLWLVENIGYRACFITAGVVCLLTTAIILLIPYRHVPKTEVKRFNINDMISLRILPYAALMGLFSCGNGLVNTFLALLGDERSISGIGLFFTAYSLVMVCTRPFVGKLQDRRGIKIILYPAYIIAAASMILLANATALWMVLLAGALKAIGQGSGAPSIQAHSLKQLGREKAGVVSSTCFIGQDIGNAIAPTIGGIVSASFGFRTMFTGYAVLLVLVGWTLFYFKSKYDEKKYGV